MAAVAEAELAKAQVVELEKAEAAEESGWYRHDDGGESRRRADALKAVHAREVSALEAKIDGEAKKQKVPRRVNHSSTTVTHRSCLRRTLSKPA